MVVSVALTTYKYCSGILQAPCVPFFYRTDSHFVFSCALWISIGFNADLDPVLDPKIWWPKMRTKIHISLILHRFPWTTSNLQETLCHTRKALLNNKYKNGGKLMYLWSKTKNYFSLSIVFHEERPRARRSSSKQQIPDADPDPADQHQCGSGSTTLADFTKIK